MEAIGVCVCVANFPTMVVMIEVHQKPFAHFILTLFLICSIWMHLLIYGGCWRTIDYQPLTIVPNNLAQEILEARNNSIETQYRLNSH